jgi:succinate dehydrogenase / fumarate reductase, membrane anchor subunit
MKSSDLRTPLGRVRGLGSAKSGTSHFLWQRVTAAVLIPLSLWFVYSLLYTVSHLDEEGVAQWLGSSLNASALIFMLLALFYHAALGVQMVIEDYIHGHGAKLAALLLNVAVMSIFTVISILAVLRLHFGIVPQGVAG